MRTAREAGYDAWIPWASALAPALIVATTLAAVAAAYQAVPYQDQWANVIEYRELLRDGFSFDWLWRQHNEHRLVFPRLIFLADMVWARGSNVLNLASILAVQTAGALLFARLALRGARAPLTLAALALAVMALFSLAQWENLVWGYQVQFVGVYACGGWSLFLLCRSVRAEDRIDWGAWAGAMALLTVCAFSMANGVLVGAAMLVLAVGARFPWRATAATLAVVAALAGAYFHGYQPVAAHSPPQLALEHPGAFIHYVVVFLGSLFGVSRPSISAVYGLLGVGLAAAMAYDIIVRRERDVAQRTLFAIVLFVGLSAAATAFGRLVFGYQQAVSSRYVTPSAWFWAAQIVFWARHAAAADRRLLKAGVGAAIGVAAFSLVLVQGRMSDVVVDWRQRVERASEALLVGVSDPGATDALYPNAAEMADWAGFLRERRLSIFAGAEGGWMGRPVDQVFGLAPQDRCLGAFDDLVAASDGAAAWRGRGWAWDTGAHFTPRRVVLADTEGRIVGLGKLGEPRPDVSAQVREAWMQDSGWTGVARPAPPGPMRAYAVLWDGRACPIGERSAP